MNVEEALDLARNSPRGRETPLICVLADEVARLQALREDIRKLLQECQEGYVASTPDIEDALANMLREYPR